MLILLVPLSLNLLVVGKGFDLFKGDQDQCWDGPRSSGLVLNVVDEQGKSFGGHDRNHGLVVLLDDLTDFVDVVLA